MKYDAQLLVALKSISVAAKALQLAADEIVKLQEQINKPDLSVVDKKS